MRRIIERRILKILGRVGAASRADLARCAGLTNTAVGDTVTSLARQDLIHFGNAADVGLMPALPSTLGSAPRPKGRFGIMLNRATLNTLIGHLKHTGIPVESKADLETVIARKPAPVFEWLENCTMALSHLIWAGRPLLDVPVIVIDADVGGGLKGLLKERLEGAARRLLNFDRVRLPVKGCEFSCAVGNGSYEDMKEVKVAV